MRKGEPYILLVGAETAPATVEVSVEFPGKAKI